MGHDKVAVVTVSYNTRELTALLLWSLRTIVNWPDLEIVVVDNGSADGSAELLAEAAQAGLAAVACEPLRETSQRVLIRLHLAEGNESEALRRYAEYRALLERKLGLAPSPRMEQLLAELSQRRLARVVEWAGT